MNCLGSIRRLVRSTQSCTDSMSYDELAHGTCRWGRVPGTMRLDIFIHSKFFFLSIRQFDYICYLCMYGLFTVSSTLVLSLKHARTHAHTLLLIRIWECDANFKFSTNMYKNRNWIWQIAWEMWEIMNAKCDRTYRHNKSHASVHLHWLEIVLLSFSRWKFVFTFLVACTASMASILSIVGTFIGSKFSMVALNKKLCSAVVDVLTPSRWIRRCHEVIAIDAITFR